MKTTKFDTIAFQATCTIETSSVITTSPITITGLPCLAIPPADAGDTETLAFLLKDAAQQSRVGHRLIYQTRRYLITHVQQDPPFSKVTCQAWAEHD